MRTLDTIHNLTDKNYISNHILSLRSSLSACRTKIASEVCLNMKRLNKHFMFFLRATFTVEHSFTLEQHSFFPAVFQIKY